MDRERRIIIFFIGAAVMLGLIGVIVLSILGRETAGVELIPTGGLALLAPSPLSKSTTPPDPPKPPTAPSQ